MNWYKENQIQKTSNSILPENDIESLMLNDLHIPMDKKPHESDCEIFDCKKDPCFIEVPDYEVQSKTYLEKKTAWQITGWKKNPKSNTNLL